jgi:hypothetical protein
MDSNLQKILAQFEELKGQFVITESWEIERLIAIGDDEQDYYYVTYDGRKTKWHTCVGAIIPLKGAILGEEYNRFIRRAKLNHWDQPIWKEHNEEAIAEHKEVVLKVNGTDKYLTEVCWDLN